MKNYIETKVEEFETSYSAEFRWRKDRMNELSAGDFFKKAMLDLLDKVQECVPEEKELEEIVGFMVTEEQVDRANVRGWNSCRETFINKLDNLRK